MRKGKVPKPIHPIKKTDSGDEGDKDLTTERDHVAVLHFIKDEENPTEESSNNNQTRIEGCTFYASLPFMSLVQNVQYPYRRWVLPINYEALVLGHIKALQNELHNPRKKSSQVPMLFGQPLPANIDPSIEVNKRYHRYYKTILTGARSIRKAIDIDEIDPILNLIRSLQGNLKLLQICTTKNIQLPWDWILCPDKNMEDGGDKLLCELFGVGVTYLAQPHELFPELRNKERILQEDFHALIIGNSYPNSSRTLVGMDEKIEIIDLIVKKSFGIKPTITRRDLSRAEIFEILEKKSRKLRLIVLSGHFDNHGFITGDNKIIDGENILNRFAHNSRPFSAKPFVLLNGCCSASGSSHGDANRSLADSFLKLGAEVCLVTSLDVRIDPAFELIKKLMEKLLEPRSTLGSSLLQARNDMDKEECYEWAAYHIIGDPSYVLVES